MTDPAIAQAIEHVAEALQHIAAVLDGFGLLGVAFLFFKDMGGCKK